MTDGSSAELNEQERLCNASMSSRVGVGRFGTAKGFRVDCRVFRPGKLAGASLLPDDVDVTVSRGAI